MLLAASVLTWSVALFLVGAGVAPDVTDVDGAPLEPEVRATFLALGAAISALPALLIALPAQRRVRHLVAAVLAVPHQVPPLPDPATWGGPERMFRRLQWSSYSYVAIPLVLLAVGAVAFGLFLGEPVAGVVFAALGTIPLFFGVVTWTLPGRLRSGVAAGVAAGQVLPVRVVSRLDQKMLLTDAYQTWFHVELADGQCVTVRTPLHFSWAGEARGVTDADDLVLVLGRGGHQGLLLSASRPQDPVWLLGPVPLTRVPRAIQAAFRDQQ